MRRWIGSALVGGTLVLGGCASMNEDECRLGDWRTIGYEDGARGASADTLGAHRSACAKHGIAPDLDEYRLGRDEGLREYCRPQRGFDLGAAGGRYSGVCPRALENAFVDAWRKGARLNELQNAVENAEDEVQKRERELETARQRAPEIEAALISNDKTPEQRAALLAELRGLGEETAEAEAALYEQRDELAQHAAALAAFQAEIANQGY